MSDKSRKSTRRRTWRRPREAGRPDGIVLKSPAEIEGLRASGRLVAACFSLLRDEIRPGVSLEALDQRVEALIADHGATPLYKGYQGNPPAHPPFPGVICASVNEEVCHGIPDARVLEEGDIVGIDIGLRYEGWCGDACVTFPVGEISTEAQHLLDVTSTCLERGIRAARAGRRLGDIGHAIQRHAEQQGCSVVRVWGGHGIGRELHEAPSVPHTGERGEGLLLEEGMVFTIEPMINAGVPDWVLLDDGWTVVTEDGALSAQFEHTIAITALGPEILSR
jgi:methionyl aminopeptidase